MVFKLPTVITSKNQFFCIELHFDGVIEVLENKGNPRFINDKKDPNKVGMNINTIHKPLFPRAGSDLGWTLNVTMDKGEQLACFIWL